jgi:hypothetical protein
LQTALKDHLYKTRKLTLWKCAEFKESSKQGESEGDFRARIAHTAKEQRDQEVERLRGKYAPKLKTAQERLRKAMQKSEKEKLQTSNQTTQAVFSVGASVLGAVFGRKLTSATNVRRISSGVGAISKIGTQHQDEALAEESVEAAQNQLNELNRQFTEESTALLDSAAADQLKLDAITIAPKKSDVMINKFTLCWTPWIVSPNGKAQQGW